MTETQTSTPGPMEQALENYLGPIDEPVGRFGTRSLRAQLNDVAREQDDIQRALVAALEMYGGEDGFGVWHEARCTGDTSMADGTPLSRCAIARAALTRVRGEKV